MDRVIRNQAREEKSDISVLKTYFGMKEGQKLTEFQAEIKALKPEDKEELVLGAAKELGWTVTE
jgi:hypothetical protein